MTTKICTRCFVEKDIEDFPLRSAFTGRRHSHCKACAVQRSGRWHENNKDRQIENAKKHRDIYRQTAKEYVWVDLLSHPCINCGESVYALEFHHARGQIETEVSRLIGRAATVDTLKAEIEKCDVLCANYHRKLTAKEQGWFSK